MVVVLVVSADMRMRVLMVVMVVMRLIIIG